MLGGKTFSALDRCNNLFFRGPTLLQSIPGMGMQSDFHGSAWVVVGDGRGITLAPQVGGIIAFFGLGVYETVGRGR